MNCDKQFSENTYQSVRCRKVTYFLFFERKDTDECATCFGNRLLLSLKIASFFSLHSHSKSDFLTLQDLTVFSEVKSMFLLQA